MTLSIKKSNTPMFDSNAGLKISKSNQFSGQYLSVNKSISGGGDSTYIVSNGYTSSFGLTTGAVITKDMTIGSSGISWTSGFFPSGSIGASVTGSRWSDWGEDIFDGWGYFYLYDPSLSQYYHFTLDVVNQADGVISTQTNTFGERIFTIKHGYPIQGVYRFDISVNDNNPFIFGGYGNMGSDSATINTNLSSSFTKDTETFILYYNYNYQSNLLSEALYSYFVPYEKEKNKDIITFQKGLLSTQFLSIYSANVHYGLTVYFAKRFDVKDWIINDLKLSSLI